MTVILELSPEVEARLRGKAEQEGKDFTIFLQSVVEREAEAVDAEAACITAQREKNQAALEVLRAWREQNVTHDASELERRRADWEEFKSALDEDRPSDRKLFP